MKRHIWLLPVLLLAALALWSGCSSRGEPGQAQYLLYFLADDEEHHGAALKAQVWAPEEERPAAGPEELMEALLAGPEEEGLTSPFPRGVTLQQWEWDPDRPGNLKIWLSEQYSGLSDISLTLADYSIVLTLAQLEGVKSVEILSAGYSTSYRSHQQLAPEEAVLSDPLAGWDSWS